MPGPRRAAPRAPRARQLVCCILAIAAVGAARAADEPAPATRPEGPPAKHLQAYAFGWSWDQGLHYGVDAPDLPATWETGELRWRPLLRGDVGIRLGMDAVGVRKDGEWSDVADDFGVRRAYLYANGEIQKLWKPISYKLEIGSVDGRFSLRNASLAIHEIPYAGTYRVGTFDPPMSISMLSSSRATPLMEQSMADEALAPGTLTGSSLMNHLADERVTWSAGFFSDGTDADVGDASDTLARFIGRVTWLPWRTPVSLLHLGLNASWAFLSQGDARFQSRAESFFAPIVVDTGGMEARHSIVLGPEVAWVRGRLSVQGEYLRAIVLRDQASNVTFGGGYALVSWFLTRDMRVYDDAEATFASMVPARPLSWKERQIGAWEVAGRWSFVDLTDGDVRGGRANELMSGLNWYWNRYLRLQCNVGWVHTSGGPRPGSATVLQARFDLLI